MMVFPEKASMKIEKGFRNPCYSDIVVFDKSKISI